MLQRDVEWISGGEIRYLDVQVVALIGAGVQRLGTTITFLDVTRYHRLQEELSHSKAELETAYEEVQAANEELETTNEELQSTNEELETTNEELQSTNEELETMNEELQSTNEELQTTNDELRQRSAELNELNAFLESILTNLRVGVVVLDGNLRVQAWNRRAKDLWGLRSEEVEGMNFLNLDLGLPVLELRQPVRACLAGESQEQDLTLPATNRRGKPITCQVTVRPLTGVSGERIVGVMVLFDELQPKRDANEPQ